MSHTHSTPDRGSAGADVDRRTIDAEFGCDGPNNHLALIYESQDEQFATAVPFVRAGLERGERCLYVVDDNTREAVVTAMQAGGIDVAAARDAGMLSLHSKEEAYLNGGNFDPADTIAFLDDTVREAVEEQGFEHVRITGEMTWMLDDEDGTDRETLAEYEAAINRYSPGEAVTTLCQYNRDRFPSPVLRDVVHTHPQLVYDERLCRNFFYVPPRQFFDEAADAAAVDYRLESVLERADLRETLEAHETDVAALAAATTDVQGAEPARIIDQTLENVREVFDTDRVAIYRYDDAADALHLRTTGTGDFDPDCSTRELRETFVTGDTRVLEGSDAAVGSADEDLVVVPLGRHGVFLTATDAGAIEPGDLAFAETVGANVRSALDQADREAMLAERTERDQEQRTRTRSLERANGALRAVLTATVEASSQPEIYQTVCDRLAAVESWQSAWVGETTATSDRVSRRATAGGAASYVDAITASATDEPTAEPAGRAAATRSSQVVDDVRAAPADANWREAALDHGFESVAAVPLGYRGVSYGVLSVYGEEPGAFDERAQSVLEDVGRAVAFACNAMDRRAALVSDRATELTLQLPPEDPFVDFATQADAAVTVDGVVPEPAADAETRYRVFFSVEGATQAQVETAAASAGAFASLSLVSERAGRLAYDGVVDGTGLLGTVLDHAAAPQSVAPDGADGRVVVRLPPSTDVASFVRMVRDQSPGAELVARREVEPEPETREGFTADLRDRLTERQWDALQTAYLSGYFEWPRDQSGEEVGERLGVSQPTFNRHLRDSLRKLLTPIFDEQGEES